jgi:heme-degrading monooxygenase HmoA
VSSITVINPFEVPGNRHEEALGLWDRANALFEQQDGFLSARLYKAVDPAARFHYVTVAEWEGVEAFMAALGSDELQALEGELAEFPHSPGAYVVVRGG